MNIKLVIFDLDGVLLDSRDFHFQALNQALRAADESYEIDYKDHLERFDGMATTQKLGILTKEKDLPESLHQQIWNSKQAYTADIIKQSVTASPERLNIFRQLQKLGIKIYVCSNAVRDTVVSVLHRMELSPYVEGIFANEDVKIQKPHPEIYWRAMIEASVLPGETLILEDSYIGRLAAYSSGAHVLGINSPMEVTWGLISKEIQRGKKQYAWEDKKLNVLIPMAGAGSRFENAGYSLPKPLIEIGNKPMIQVVVDNLNVKANFIFVIQKKHSEQYNLKFLLNVVSPGCRIIEVDGLTEGACSTTLLAEKYINNDNPLLIANSDQFVECECGRFFHAMNAKNVDGGIFVFKSTHPKWSYVRVNDYGNVFELKEKQVISDIATVGIYYWKKGSEYIKYARQMISLKFH